jgi:hypothetical protein
VSCGNGRQQALRDPQRACRGCREDAFDDRVMAAAVEALGTVGRIFGRKQIGRLRACCLQMSASSPSGSGSTARGRGWLC